MAKVCFVKMEFDLRRSTQITIFMSCLSRASELLQLKFTFKNSLFANVTPFTTPNKFEKLNLLQSENIFSSLRLIKQKEIQFVCHLKVILLFFRRFYSFITCLCPLLSLLSSQKQKMSFLFLDFFRYKNLTRFFGWFGVGQFS